MPETQTYTYPPEFVPPEEKNTAQYCKRVISAFWQEASVQNCTWFPQSGHLQMAQNRLYADGRQSVDIYKPYFGINPNAKSDTVIRNDNGDPIGKKGGGNKSWVNINWRILPIAPKFVETMMGYFEKMGEKFVVTAIDPDAIEFKKQFKAMRQAQVVLADISAQVNAAMNIKDPAIGGFAAQTMEEVDMEMQFSYKLTHEASMELCLNYIATLNELDDLTKRMIIRSLVVDGIGGAKRYIDADGTIKVRPLDMINVYMGYSKRPDFKDMDKVGELVTMSISELKRQAGGQFTEEQYKQIAWTAQKGYSGTYNGWPTEWNNCTNGSYVYDTEKINVFDAEFRTTNSIKYKMVVNSNGRLEAIKEKLSYKTKKNDVNAEAQVWFQGKWIVGTEFIYDWGVNNSMVRDPGNKSIAYSSFHIYRTHNQSVVERGVPCLDQIQLAVLKIQTALATARPKGMAISLESLEQAASKLEGVDSPLELVALYNQTGNVIFQWQDIDDTRGRPNQLPFQELAGGAGPILSEGIESINENMGLLRNVMGLDAIMDGSLGNPRQGVKTAEMAKSATDNALLMTYCGWLNIKYNLGNCMADMVVQMVKDGKVPPGYDESLGAHNFRCISINSDFTERSFGMDIEPYPTDAEQQVIENYIALALQATQAGQPGGIELEDAFAIRDMMKFSVHTAQMLLIQRKRQRDKENTAKQMQLMQAKGQTDQQSAASASQMRQQEIGQDYQQKSALQNQLIQGNLLLEQTRHKNKLEEIAASGQVKSRHLEQEAVSDTTIHAMNNTAKLEIAESKPKGK